MAEKLAQTMLTLAEDNHDMQTSLRLMLKYEVQHLLERLRDLGEESVLLMANVTQGTSGKLGSQVGGQFLATMQTDYCCDLKNNFLQFCSNRPGMNMCAGQQQMPQLQQMQQQQKMQQQQQQQMQQSNFSNMNSFPNQQVNPGSNRFAPYGMTQQRPQAQQQQQQQNNMPNMPNFWNSTLTPAVQLAKKSTESKTNPDGSKRKRTVCRHFLGKGHCWQGPMCSFLHTRDPDVLSSLNIQLDELGDTGGGGGRGRGGGGDSSVGQNDTGAGKNRTTDLYTSGQGEDDEQWSQSGPD